MDKASEVLFALKPVSFRYNKEYDATQTVAFGLIAEEVVEVNPDLVGRNDKGQPESLRYDQINAMLLNEFLKEHRKVEELETSFAKQQKDFQSKLAEQRKQIEALSAGLQKVSAQVEMNRPAAQVVNNNQ
jgi:endosialidase-like protein